MSTPYVTPDTGSSKHHATRCGPYCVETEVITRVDRDGHFVVSVAPMYGGAYEKMTVAKCTVNTDAHRRVATVHGR